MRAAYVNSANYVVDNAVQVHVEPDHRHRRLTLARSQRPYQQRRFAAFPASCRRALADGQNVMLSIDGGAGVRRIDSTDTYWSDGQDSMHLEDGVHTIAARVVDSAPPQRHLHPALHDRYRAPTMLSSPAGASGGAPDALVFTFDEAMYLVPSEGAPIYFTDAEGHTGGVYLDDSNFSADRRTLTISAADHHYEPGQDYTSSCRALITDLAGNRDPQPASHAPADLQRRYPGAQRRSAATLTSSGIYGLARRSTSPSRSTKPCRRSAAARPRST